MGPNPILNRPEYAPGPACLPVCSVDHYRSHLSQVERNSALQLLDFIIPLISTDVAGATAAVSGCFSSRS